MKNKLISLLIISCLFFVGCSKTAIDDQVTTNLTNEFIEVGIDDVELELQVNDSLYDLTENEVVGVVVESNQDELISTREVNLAETETTKDDVIKVEPVVEVLEAYLEVEPSSINDSVYTLSYNLTGNLDIESHVFDQVNELRESLGIAPLKSNDVLVNGAYIRSIELQDLFSHTRPNGTDWFTIFEEIPYSFRACGENLTTGSGFTREQAYNKIFDSWYNSPGHYSNMVNPDFKEIGIAVCFDSNGTYYATQIFGTIFD